MAVYADYLFYTQQFDGTAIAQADYRRLARKASAHVNQLTFGRAAEIIEADTDVDLIEAIRLATCAVAEELQRQQENGSVISSERVGSYAVTYAVSPASGHERLATAAKLYLVESGMMYRGFDDESVTAMLETDSGDEEEDSGDGGSVPT